MLCQRNRGRDLSFLVTTEDTYFSVSLASPSGILLVPRTVIIGIKHRVGL